MIKTEDREFLHGVTNKLAKIEGFTEILKSEVGETHPILAKILKANTEALELVKSYRALLESRGE